jgi:hypothetical protein
MQNIANISKPSDLMMISQNNNLSEPSSTSADSPKTLRQMIETSDEKSNLAKAL